MAAAAAAFSRGNVVAVLSFLSLLACAADAQLSPSFYHTTCPKLQDIVRSVMVQVVSKEPRMGASILRLFFHDCFVNGCDASILLDDALFFLGEKNLGPNSSVRGYEVIDAIKSEVEAACRRTVSCADILALAARDAVAVLGGPSWQVALGRRDATTVYPFSVTDLPSSSSDLSGLVSTFAEKGFSAEEMTALSGAHTVGVAQCSSFRSHIYNDDNVDDSFAALRMQNCPRFFGGGSNIAPLELQNPSRFGNEYYQDLVSRRGLLHSDQELYNGGSQDALVRMYAANATLFYDHFSAAMVKMGNISPLTGENGEVRLNCREVN